ncbi:predicted protein [Sclerotinia sclerotiorum 1980 UF-70]|uniref:Uncharacterized protein n=1 Tax=Sclerotinia sclerotiorum (strain ATCC 18683 / 1980 / Ss-1) TaxID=665079 RepID=A7F4E3_SCLS1|nr:predicted protein [Sclerotinia sclerotiorum 1980 UF-70]EDN97614.1 predicted protein [Sclerotinia sclerotiorum 1980 UF-70]
MPLLDVYMSANSIFKSEPEKVSSPQIKVGLLCVRPDEKNKVCHGNGRVTRNYDAENKLSSCMHSKLILSWLKESYGLTAGKLLQVRATDRTF